MKSSTSGTQEKLAKGSIGALTLYLRLSCSHRASLSMSEGRSFRHAAGQVLFAPYLLPCLSILDVLRHLINV